MWKIDRTTIFLCVVLILFLWDLAFFIGIRNPDILPHPLVYFRELGDIEFLRGFPFMLRQIIFSATLGGLIGAGVASLLLRNDRLTRAALQVLHLGQWLPFIVLFATPDPWTLGIAAAGFCACYHCLAARSLLDLNDRETLAYVARAASLQALLISLLSQVWLQFWNWFDFVALNRPLKGFQVLLVLLMFLFLTNWVFRIRFDLMAERCGSILLAETRGGNWGSFIGVFLYAIFCLIIWQIFPSLRYHPFQSSPLGILRAGYSLLMEGEIWGDITLSLFETLGGVVFFLGGGVVSVNDFRILNE